MKRTTKGFYGLLIIWFLSLAVLSGCGGGGGGGSSSSSGTTSDGGGTTTDTTTATLSGTAAKGAPFASVAVSIKDKNGSAKTGTTGTDGKYTIDITGMTAPFLLKVSDGTITYYSVSTATGTATANIHQFTDLIIRNWYKVKGSDVETDFSGSGALSQVPTATEIDTIEAVVVNILSSWLSTVGLSTSTFNLITSSFNADGTGFDKVLDNNTVTIDASGNVTITSTDPTTGSQSTILSTTITTDLTTITIPTATIIVNGNPTVVSKSTDGSSCAVDTGAAISVIFNEDMDASTITTSTFTVSGASGTVTYDSTAKKAIFTPSSALTYSTAYTATLTTGVKDTAGNVMANSFSWIFTTKQGANPSYLMGGAIQGNSLSPYTNVVTTFAGTAGYVGSTDGTGSAARFNFPYGITTDGTNLYVADTSNNTIRKIVISTGAVTTLAGSAGLTGSTNGTGAAARFNYPQGVTTDGTNLYVADSNNHTIRKIVIATGAVTTLAGTAGSVGSTDGTGSVARFNFPYGITTDGTNLYVADTSNNTIRKIVIATGAVTTLAGSAVTTFTIGGIVGSSGSADGTGAAARFHSPRGITTDGTNLYVADSNNNTIRKIVISTGAVTTLAGSAGLSGSTDGTGSAARFSSPYGITTDGTNLYVADGYGSLNYVVRKIVISTGAVTTVAGSGASIFYVSTGITTDGTNLYVADTSNNTIRKISASTTVPSSAPTNVTATDGNGQTTITWDSVSGATCYDLYCAVGTSVSTTTGTEIFYIASPYTYTGLTNGTTYACIVTAVNNYGEGPASSPPTPSTPAASHTLSISKSGTGSGTVTSTPSGIDCGSTCTASVTTGTTVTLTATAASGSTFSGWSGGGCSGTGSCAVTMDSDKTVTAAFAVLPTLTVSKSGTGSGTVTSSPSGISCGSTCSSSFTNGSSVTLTATPASGYTFTGWSGACSGTGSCTVTMDSDKTVTATFTTSTSGNCPTSISIDSGIGGWGSFFYASITPATSGVTVNCSWKGSSGSTSSKTATTTPDGKAACADSNVASWGDSTLTLTASIPSCNLSASTTY